MPDAYLYVDTSDADDELDRLADAPDTELTLAFESIISTQFALTQQYVHIITGKLRESGRVSGQRERHTWTGQIAYTAKHASKERNRDIDRLYEPRGWLAGTDAMGRTNVDHDFLKHIYDSEPEYGEVIKMFMRGEIP